MRSIRETSVIIKMVKRSKGRVEVAYQNSKILYLRTFFRAGLARFLKYSFLRRIADIREGGSFEIPDNSRIIRYVINVCGNAKSRLISCADSSRAYAFLREISKEFYILPLRKTGIVIIAAVTVNTVLAFVFQAQIAGVWPWLTRGIFLFIGIAGLFCGSGWPELKSGSSFLKDGQ